MKKINFKIVVSTLVAVFTIGVAGITLNSPTVSAAEAMIDLKTATPFAILSGTPGITDSPTSVINGNVGLYPGPGSGIVGLLCTQVTGIIYARDATGNICFTVNEPLLDQAKQDVTAAYIDAAGRFPVTLTETELGGKTLVPGVYIAESTTLQITAGAGPLILDAQGDSSAVFIFQAPASEPGLTIGDGSVVQLAGGASACNVFWRVDSASIGTTAVFKGTILALNSITVNNGANIEGRLLARNGQVTLINDIVTVPTCIIPVVITPTTTVVPKLPNTGLVSNSNLIAISASAVIATSILVSLAIVMKKRAL